MSDAAVAGETFVLSAGPPVRALAISAGTTIIGAGLIVAAAAADLPVAWSVIGLALLIFGIVLGVTGMLLVARLKTTVVTGADGLTVTRGRRVRRVAWAQVTDVRLAQPKLLIKVSDEEPLVLVNLRRPTDPTFGRLLITLQRRLDADRGYGAAFGG